MYCEIILKSWTDSEETLTTYHLLHFLLHHLPPHPACHCRNCQEKQLRQWLSWMSHFSRKEHKKLFGYCQFPQYLPWRCCVSRQSGGTIACEATSFAFIARMILWTGGGVFFDCGSTLSLHNKMLRFCQQASLGRKQKSTKLCKQILLKEPCTSMDEAKLVLSSHLGIRDSDPSLGAVQGPSVATSYRIHVWYAFIIQNQPNVGKYVIHGSYGYCNIPIPIHATKIHSNNSKSKKSMTNEAQ